MELHDKVVIVTGGAGPGSGRSIARRFARAGAAVVICDVNERGGHEIVAAIAHEGGRATFIRTDVSNEEDVRAAVAHAEETYGGLDVLVNGASAEVYPENTFDEAFANLRVDLLGAMYATRAAINPMRRRGGGAIVNISSTSALRHGGHGSKAPGYDTAKAALVRWTTSLASLRDGGIRINCIVPDWIGTPHILSVIAAMSPEERARWRVPATLIQPDDLADLVARVATDETLAGRVMVWWCGRPPQLIPDGDAGYAALEDERS